MAMKNIIKDDNRSARRKKELYRKQSMLKKIIVVSIIMGILAILVASSHCISAENSRNAGKIANAADKSSAIAAITKFSQDSIYPEQDDKPVYETKNKFTVNTKRLSKETIKDLNENISAEFVALYDATADELIYVKNADKKCYPASTTKMLTAIVASQIIKDPDTVITVGDEITLIGEDSSVACLEEGMQLTFEMLLDALLLPSGNDAAYTIAVNCGRIYKDDPNLSNEEAVNVFMELVNDAAEQIGASQTHYITPDGWHDDNHYTSAIDLVKVGAYAKSIPIVAKSCAKPYAEWKLIKGGTLCWYNSNKLIQWDSGLYSEYCDGLKTGFTDQAGTSVVASATIDGHTFIAAVMNAETLYTKYEDCHKMFKYGFELYKLNYTYDD